MAYNRPTNANIAARGRPREERLEKAWEERFAGLRCPYPPCGKPMPRPKDTGRPRVWCSDQCRRAAARDAARAARTGTPDSTADTAGAGGDEVRRCPRPGCEAALPYGADRRRIWCSDACRRAAGEERRAAAAGAIAVKVVERERVVERRVEVPVDVEVDHDLDECVRRALASPGACRRILQALTRQARDGGLDDAKWSPVADAGRAFGVELYRR